MITAYCDGSYSAANSVGVATAILLTETHYLKMCTKVYENMVNQLEIEVYGILQCLEVAQSIGVKELTIYCDSIEDVGKANKILQNKTVPSYFKPYHLWRKFLKLSKGIDIQIYHTYGHDMDMNPNKLCDYISNAIVRKVVG